MNLKGLINSIQVVIAIILISFCGKSHAQYDINPHFEKRRLTISELPFNEVNILDKRFDTVLFYVNESGIYPPGFLAFQGGAKLSMERYFNDAVAGLPHLNNRLLIRLNQCRIPNRQLIKRKIGRHRYGIGRWSHERLLLDADVYCQVSDGQYKHIMDIQKRYFISKQLSILQVVDNMMDEITMAICKYYAFTGERNKSKTNPLKGSQIDKKKIRFIYDTTLCTFKYLDSGAVDRWKLSPIFTGAFDKNGMFETFDDFKENKIKEDKIKLDSVSTDSVFHFSGTLYSIKKRFKMPFAIVYNGRCYIGVFIGSYLPIEKDNNIFRFYVPGSLPDMYALLSCEYYYFAFSKSSEHYNRIETAIIGIAINAVEHAIKEKRDSPATMLTEGIKHNFRYCIIDLDNGDFLYADHP